MSDIFAKIFDTEKGQILAVIQGGEKAEPEVRLSCKPEGMGVCQSAIVFDDSDEGWKNADSLFDSLDEKKVLDLTGDAFSFGEVFVEDRS